MAEEENSENTPSPGMQKAMDDGWTPQEQWKGEPSDWVDYAEFNVRGELMGRIKEQSGILHQNKQELSDLRDAVQDLKKLNSKIAENEYKKVLKKLRADKAQAIENSDGALVTQVEEDIETLQNEWEKTQSPEGTEGKPNTATDIKEHPDVAAWLKKPENQWYHTNEDARIAATAIAQSIVASNPATEPAEVLRLMTERVKRTMPTVIKNKSAVDTGDASGGNDSSGTKNGLKFSDLDDVDKAACKRFVRLGVMTQDEYLKQRAELEG